MSVKHPQPINSSTAPIARLLNEYYRLRWNRAKSPSALFPAYRTDVARELAKLWQKYSTELLELSTQLAVQCKKMKAQGHKAGFYDIEAELLYILLRELTPSLVYEISPNCGYSTNYLLAAVTANEFGRVESFEITETINGIPIDDVIANNLLPLCDKERFHLNVGDARIRTLERLADETPDFTMIDSCHDDFFAEFYIKELLPRLRGAVLIQDVAHFDPRPEWSTEAYYVLSYLQKTKSEYLFFADYENELNDSGARSAYPPRNPCRSNSIVLALGETCAISEPPARMLDLLNSRVQQNGGTTTEYPLTSRSLGQEIKRPIRSLCDHPEDDYVAAMQGDHVNLDQPVLADTLALAFGRAPLSAEGAVMLLKAAHAFDGTQKILSFEALARAGEHAKMKQMLNLLEDDIPLGGELPARLAEAAWAAGFHDAAGRWAARAHENSKDLSLATGYRQSLRAARVLLRLGRKAEARSYVREALEGVSRRQDDILRKASQEAFLFALRNPAFLRTVLKSRLYYRALAPAIGNLTKAVIRKVRKKISLSWHPGRIDP